MKKKISLILLLSVIITAFASCGGKDISETDSFETSQTSAEESTAPNTYDDTSEAKLSLPENLDFGGKIFTVLACNEDVPYTYFELAEQNGDGINDALYERNTAVEENLNVKLAISKIKGIDTAVPVSKSVMAGDHAFDLISPHILNSLSTLVTEKYLYELDSLPYLDFDKPWWNQSFTDTLSINGNLYFAAGDIIVPNARVIVFNKQMMINFGKDDMYETVRSGGWTLDKMGDYTKDMNTDMDGNGKMDSADQYAFSDLKNTGLATSFVHASNMLFVEKDDGGYHFTLSDDKMDVIINKLYDSLYKDGNIEITNTEFGGGNVLFGSQVLLKLQILRSYDTDFGIIPFPKFDNQQEKYYSSVWNGLICVPKDVTNPECVGAVLEAMAYYSSETLIPAYHNNLLDSKFSRDTESGEMLEIIFDGLVYDFGLCFDNFKGNYSSIGTLLVRGSTDIASFWAKNENVFKAHYDSIFESVKSN